MNSASWRRLDSLPAGFLEVKPTSLQEVCPTPTLIHLPGRRTEPLFVSIMLHGNEDVGLRAVQRVLRELHDQELPRACSILVGNVAAARRQVRRLEGQPDYNRVWPGTEEPDCPEARMMAEIVDEMAQRRVFASLDLHNNTGVNPLYACVCSTAAPHLQLATWFSRTVVYFTRPKGVQTMAFQPHCPSITCECGKIGDESGVEQAAELIRACLHAEHIPNRPPVDGDIHLFHTVATVKVPPATSISFHGEPADLMFTADLDRWNFNEIGPGAELAVRGPGSHASLLMVNERGEDCRHEFLAESGNSLRLKKRVLPSMLTIDPQVIRQDCLCYLMERYDRAATKQP